MPIVMALSIRTARPSRRPWRLVVTVLGGLVGIVMLRGLWATKGEEAEAAARYHPDSLVGAWVRVYPASPRRLAIILRKDGTAVGQTPAAYAYPLEWISQWSVGDDPHGLGPNDLCFSNPRLHGETRVCSGWILRGDTLALANGQNTVLIRAAASYQATARSDSAVPDDRARFGPLPEATRSPVHNRP